MDGGSTDHTAAIIRKYQDRITFWCSEKDKGQSDAINKGWRRAKGDILAYLNSDDALAENALEKVAGYFEKHPEAGIIYGDCQVIDEKGNDLGVRKGKQLTYNMLLKNGQRGITQPAAFFNAAIVKKVGYLNPQWHLSMDYDLILKIARESEIAYIPETLASFRIHTGAKSSLQTQEHWNETFLVRNQYSDAYPYKMKLNYLKFRFLTASPPWVEYLIRKLRNTPRDRIFLKTSNSHIK